MSVAAVVRFWALTHARLQAEAEYSTFVSTKFGARGPSVELGMASNALFEDATVSLATLEERLVLLQRSC